MNSYIKSTELKSKLPINKITREYPPEIIKLPFYLPICRRNYIKNEPINRMSELSNESVLKKMYKRTLI